MYFNIEEIPSAVDGLYLDSGDSCFFSLLRSLYFSSFPSGEIQDDTLKYATILSSE